MGETMNININPKKIYELVNKDVQCIDIREKYEYDDLHIKNFIHIPYEDILSSLYLLSKDKPIYIICQHGNRAKIIAQKLRELNYDAYYIDDGFQAFLHIPPDKYY